MREQRPFSLELSRRWALAHSLQREPMRGSPVGQQRNDTTIQLESKRRRAAAAQCATCGRKSALRSSSRIEKRQRADGSTGRVHIVERWCYWSERGLCDRERTVTERPWKLG